jgi:type I restriction enzyme S subunit
MIEKWPNVQLGHLLREEREQIGTFNGSDFPVLGVTNTAGVTQTGVEASDDKSKYLRVRPGSFVYNPYRVNVGSIGLASEGQHGICSPAYVVFSPSNALNAHYLLFYLKSARGSQLINFYGNRGSVRSALRFADLEQIEIPLAPLAEQHRIVARIEMLAARIKKVSTLRQQSSQELNVLHAKLINKEFDPYRNNSTTIGETFRVTTGGTPARGNPDFWGGQIKWASSGEVAFCRINNTAETITALGSKNSNAKVYPPATVLVAMIGQGKTRGQCAILDCEAATNQNVAAIHVYETSHLPEYVYWWFFASYQRSRSVETGTAQPALSAERIKKIRIPLPAPISQKEIVRRLERLQAQVDSLKCLQTETTTKMNALLPAILDLAFKGKL